MIWAATWNWATPSVQSLSLFDLLPMGMLANPLLAYFHENSMNGSGDYEFVEYGDFIRQWISGTGWKGG